MTNPTPRTRTRNLSVEGGETMTPEDRAKVLLVHLAAANAAKNAATQRENKLKKELGTLMAQSELRNVSTKTDHGTATAKLATGSATSVDVEQLHKEVPFDVFMKCISASQQSVKDNAGGAVLLHVLRTYTTEEKFSFSLSKF
jgi:hypothetical protein